MANTATLADVLPGQEFTFDGQTLRMAKVNKTTFRASTEAGDVKSFKAPNTRTVNLVTAEPKAELPANVKWRGKVRETKTIVSIRDTGPESDVRWLLTCEDHDQTALRAGSAQAWVDAAHPRLWCATCSVV